MAQGGVVVDVRALQAHEHASRGIGRYSAELIHAVEQVDPTLVRAYVADPVFPMHERLRDVLDTGKVIRSDHRSLVDDPPRVLHLTSPFVEGHGPVRMLPGWASATDTRLVATVYDLIPARFPEIYLTDPNVAAQYRSRVQLLRSCDRLLTISDTTTMDLVSLVGVPGERIVTVHGAAGDHFMPPVGPPVLRTELDLTAGGYVLCPSGAEWRKNLDRLLQGWALVARNVRSRWPLVVQCAMDPATWQHWERRCDDLGVRDDVRFTGAVGEDDLVALMQAARLVVFPSLYEGLGLPVLEARRCGAPVVVGDNSSLRELVPDAGARFDAHDVASIATTIEGHLVDDDQLDRLRSTPVDARYSWPEVGRAVVEVYRALLAEPPRRPARPRRPRLAIASPVPPQLSGPSAYMASLLEHLPAHADITLLSSIAPGDAQVPSGVRVESLSTLEQLETLEGPFDEVLYLLGNSGFHIDELAALRRRPGAVLLHDARLTLLYTEMFRQRPELLPRTFGGALHEMYPGRYPAAMGGAQYLPLHEEGQFGVLMVAEVARLATRLFVHSEHAAQLIELDCGRRPEVIFAIPSPDPAPARPEPARPEPARPEPARTSPLVASFGFVSPAKCSGVVLSAMADLPDAELGLVGHSGEDYLSALRRDAAVLGVSERVTVTGQVDESAYRDWLDRAAIAVQLRLHSNGESSASVAETLAAGIPTIVTDIGSFAEYPDDVVVKVAPGISSGALAAVIAELLADAPRRAALADAARGYAARNSYASAAATMVDTLVGTRV